jgi:6-phosphofructokinase 1
MAKKIGILTAGSDVPGLNAAIRAFGKAAIHSYGMELIGFQDGFEGLLLDRTMPIQSDDLSNILTAGGTFLGTSRRKSPSERQSENEEIQTGAAAETYRRHDLDALVCIGGRGTIHTALQLSRQGLNVITLPKALDNHIPGTERSIGFRTAAEIATEAIDRLHSTAHSNHRIIIVELMGFDAGWLTLAAGLAGGADVILLPEIPYDVQNVAAVIATRNAAGKRFSIIAVAESARTRESVKFFEHTRRVNDSLRSGEEREGVASRLSQIENRTAGSTLLLANRLEQLTGLDTRVTILGYLLRGGAPSATDRVLATQLGSACAHFVSTGVYGVMVGAQGDQTVAVPLEQIDGQVRLVPPDHPWVTAARSTGISFGD